MPAASSAASSSGVKCSAAVGAATAPSLLREHRLVIAPVGVVGRALAGDIGRQRHRALRARAGLRPARRPRRPGSSCHRRGALRRVAVTPAAKAISSPSRSRLALRTKACQRRDRSACAGSRRSSPRPRAAFELGRDHAGIVEHQHVARAQQARQVAHGAVRERVASPRATSIRAASRGRAGRSAIRSGGSSKSNRSTRMARASRLAARRMGSLAWADRLRSSESAEHVGGDIPQAAAVHGRGRRPVVGGDRGLEDLGRVRGGSPRSIASTASMPGDHPAEIGVFPVEAEARVEHDEELAVGAVISPRRAPSRRCRARAASG